MIRQIFSDIVFKYRWTIGGFYRRLSSGVCACLAMAMVLFAGVTPTPEASSTTPDPIPIFAYYYIWFDATSWDRAKKDYPLLGRYSSDDPKVMRQHIQWAKSAGLIGFIVSWKSADKLNSRLAQLVKIADEENFKLGIIYEGLDFSRNPLPVGQVDADLKYFLDKYANDPAFDYFDKPLIIWSGTWKYSVEEIQSVVQDKRDRAFILASEKNVEGYQRLANIVDGDAYYWSSVNPESQTGHMAKLTEMSVAIHANHGLWIAPAAPGFDARLLGGTSFVDRKDGETLRKEMLAALQSNPDAIGLISWNEFSENSHIEPSQNYGNRYLQVLSQIRNTKILLLGDFDSSGPDGTTNNNPGVVIGLSLLSMLIFGSLFVIVRRLH
jgi:glycosyl hydrolase family 99